MKMKNKIIYIALAIFVLIVAILGINYLNTPKEGNFININYADLSEKVNHGDNFILVVTQSTCSHCATYKPKLIQITKDYGIDIYYIDYDEEDKATQEKFLKEFHLSGATPMTLFFEKGKEKSILSRIEGDLSSTKVIDTFKKMKFIK